MNLRKIAGALVVAIAACAALTPYARAEDKIASFTTGSSNPFTFTSDGGSGGTLVTTNGASNYVQGAAFGPTLADFNQPAFMKFGPLSLLSVNSSGKTALFATGNPPGTSFQITTGANGGGTVLLEGWFQYATMDYSANNQTQHLFNLGFESVVYTGGTYYNLFPGSSTDPQLTGNLTLTFGVNQITENGSGGLNSFTTTTLDGNFTATADNDVNVTAVPEPEEYAVMGMVSLTLCGLMIRARRRTATRSFGNWAA